ncbi:hypothetical protein A2U01_0117890, partial [Trifolium medium]|nr:hypothetical protein [Trifolium medium]
MSSIFSAFEIHRGINLLLTNKLNFVPRDRPEDGCDGKGGSHCVVVKAAECCCISV